MNPNQKFNARFVHDTAYDANLENDIPIPFYDYAQAEKYIYNAAKQGKYKEKFIFDKKTNYHGGVKVYFQERGFEVTVSEHSNCIVITVDWSKV